MSLIPCPWITFREKVRGFMGVKLRQKVKGKGNPWWVFISHNKQRTSMGAGVVGLGSDHAK